MPKCRKGISFTDTVDPVVLRRAVEHLLIGLPLVAPYQLSFSLMSGTPLHRMLGFDVAEGKLKYGWASQLDPVEMASHEQVAGGNYTPWDEEPPSLHAEEWQRWALVFEQIHIAVHNGKIVRFGVCDDGFCSTVEDKPGTGITCVHEQLVHSLERALRSR